jgi:hypothetical protein
VLFCFVIVPGQLAAAEAQSQVDELPRTIEYDRSLHGFVAELMRRSSTFRQQCAVIAAAKHVRIRVVVTPPSRLTMAPRAVARIERYDFGLIRARIELPAAGAHTEYLPHEFEHVIEQIEGLNLAELTRAGDPGVVQIENGMFETTRARLAGRAVAAEVYGKTDPAVRSPFRTGLRVLKGLSLRVSRGARVLVSR